jgi:cytochrome P460
MWRAPAAATFLLACAVDARPPATGELPQELAGYRSWPAVLADPQPVPFEMWTRCIAATAADWDRAREKHGPHTQRFIRVYANPPAAQRLRRDSPAAWPVGAVIVKEKLRSAADTAPDGVAFMVKRGDGRFRESGGWEFAYFPPGPEPRRTHEACAACHRVAAATDYVFGTY